MSDTIKTVDEVSIEEILNGVSEEVYEPAEQAILISEIVEEVSVDTSVEVPEVPEIFDMPLVETIETTQESVASTLLRDVIVKVSKDVADEALLKFRLIMELSGVMIASTEDHVAGESTLIKYWLTTTALLAPSRKEVSPLNASKWFVLSIIALYIDNIVPITITPKVTRNDVCAWYVSNTSPARGGFCFQPRDNAKYVIAGMIRGNVVGSSSKTVSKESKSFRTLDSLEV